MILYSIIIAVYNVEKYLADCLDSIIGQTYQNWEAILVNDGSIDSSGAICDRYAAKDSRFKVFHNENNGSLMARRYGISQAKGDYILVIDSDDLIHRELLEYANSIIDVNRYSMFIYKMKWGIDEKSNESQTIYPEGTVLNPKSNEKDRNSLWMNVLQSTNLNNLCLKIISNKCIDFETDYSNCAHLKSGTDMIQSLAVLDKAETVYFSEKAYYYYRQNTGGISDRKQVVKSEAEICSFFENKKILTEMKLKYAEKNIELTKEILNQYYTNNFDSVVNVLASWYLSASQKQRRMITKTVIQQDYFELYRENIDTNRMSMMKRKIYEGILKANVRKIEFWMFLPTIKKRIVHLMIGK